MEGIRSDKYREGHHEYWLDPAFNGKVTEAIAATRYELEQIREFLS